MDGIGRLADRLREAWIALGPGPLAASLLKAALVAAAVFVIVGVIERAAGTRTSNYRSREFAHDLGYWFYYRAGIHDILLMGAIIAALERPLSVVALNLFAGWPFAAQVAAYLVIGDFIAYWVHRAEHRFRFMWAFHTTHHSQERLTFATIARFHPVEMIYHNLLAYIPMRAMGVEPVAWLPVYLALQLFTGVQHTQIPWRFGPLYKVIATPAFHSYHHSTDPAHHDRNFANLLSAWDYLFGTAVKDTAPRPARWGLIGIAGDTLIGSLVMPFRLLHRFYLAPLRPSAIEKQDLANGEEQTTRG
jgi:sterol desaturase/sphingolipid hydroxylase (fatty acid hydroxylase superfamily)